MSEVNLLDTDVEGELRATVRGMLADRCRPRAVAAMYDGDRSIVDPLWKTLAADLGLAGLLVPESDGGAGASAREAAVVVDELGRAVAPVPFLTSSVIATSVLLGSGTTLLADLASGERTAALVVPLSLAPGDALPAFGRHANGGAAATMTSVAGALEADVLLVPVRAGEGIEVVAVAASEARIEPVVSLDQSRQLADVTLDGVAGVVAVPAESGDTAVRRGLAIGAALLASEQVGIARWCLETSVEYLKERRQFGRVVGGFQAPKHRLADLYTSVETGTAAARYASATIAADGPDAALATAVAQAFCSDLAVHAAEEAVQLHGGIGMTWEHPAHLYLKRAKADQIALGTPGAHRRLLAPLAGLPAAEVS